MQGHAHTHLVQPEGSSLGQGNIRQYTQAGPGTKEEDTSTINATPLLAKTSRQWELIKNIHYLQFFLSELEVFALRPKRTLKEQVQDQGKR